MILDSHLIQVASFVGLFLAQFAGLIWKLSQIQDSLKNIIYKVEKDFDLELQILRKEIAEAQLAATNVYMRKDYYREIITSLDARLIRMEGKIDTAIAQKKVRDE